MFDDDLKYISELVKKLPNREHAEIIGYRDKSLAEGDYLHSELKSKGVCGNVIATYRDEKEALHYVVEGLSNECILGSTGSGKSTRLIAAQMMLIAESGTANMVVIDSKGALYKQFAARIKALGYKVLLFNPTKYEHSEGWNPFFEAATAYREKMDGVGVGVKKVNKKGGTFFLYRGHAYADKAALMREYEREIQQCEQDLQTGFRATVKEIWCVKSGKDPYWEESAQTFILAVYLGLALDLFALEKTRRTRVEQINFANVKRIIESFGLVRGTLADRGYFTGRGEGSIVYNAVKRNVLNNAQNTASNILGFVESAIQTYSFSNFLYCTQCSTFSMRELTDERTVLFLVNDETDSLSMKLTSAFISALLQKSKEIADGNENSSLERPLLFLIDEFAALPKIDAIPRSISYARSRQIHIHLVLQSLSQLYATYGEQDSETILNNCNTTVYLGCNDQNTVAKFSASLGKCTVISPASVLNGNVNVVLEECPVVPCSHLAQFKMGEAYIKRFGKNPVKAHFEACYQCPEYDCQQAEITDYKSGLTDCYNACKFDPTFIVEDEDDLF